VAQRIRPFAGEIAFGDFERAVDQLFDDLLLSRWRTPGFEYAPVVDHGGHYEVRIAAAGADPRRMEVEVTERRLHVRISGIARPVDRSFELAHAVDPAGVTARWTRGVLEIRLPKKRGHKIRIE
jgi:HSP20 family molecular chaperone IbpA